ncbi:hypothetical protein AMTRI_Chr12g239760 [Amborella trichopoda]
MADLKEPLLPPRPGSSSCDKQSRPSASGRPLFQGMDFLGLKKRSQGPRSWIKVDSSGNSEVLEVDKFTMMRHCDLLACGLRLLDPLFVYPSTILGREKAIVVNLEQIRCIITADEVLFLAFVDNYVLRYAQLLQKRLTMKNDMGKGGMNFDDFLGSESADYLPFEFRVLEVALEAACTFLESQAAALVIKAYPLSDELTSKISTLHLEGVRRLKSRLVALTRRVQKKKRRVEKNVSLARSRHDCMKSSDSTTENIEESTKGEINTYTHTYINSHVNILGPTLTTPAIMNYIFEFVSGAFGLRSHVNVLGQPLANERNVSGALCSFLNFDGFLEPFVFDIVRQTRPCMPHKSDYVSGTSTKSNGIASLLKINLVFSTTHPASTFHKNNKASPRFPHAINDERKEQL